MAGYRLLGAGYGVAGVITYRPITHYEV